MLEQKGLKVKKGAKNDLARQGGTDSGSIRSNEPPRTTGDQDYLNQVRGTRLRTIKGRTDNESQVIHMRRALIRRQREGFP